jgi:starvation-inducible DNA-binding protein
MAPQERSDNGSAAVPIRTKNNLPEETRAEMVKLLNLSLAEAVDLMTQCKQAHWNVKGPHFSALHKLFDEVHEAVAEYVDLLAERVVQLGGLAQGTARAAVAVSRLKDYPVTITKGEDHVQTLSSQLTDFGALVREAIEKADDAGDADTADIFTEVSRGTDQWLWFVEAHQQTGVKSAAN